MLKLKTLDAFDKIQEGDIKVIQLDEFGEVEALEFVRKALNIENNLQDREIEELTRELQYFPLALGQAVVYIQDRNEESRLRGDKRFKISDYLKEYQQNAGELLKKGVYENEDRYTKTVLTTWNITMTYICKEYGFEALSILEIMAYLAPDNIRIKEIFSKLITDDKAKLWNAVELLNRYSMIKLREGVVNIHRLVQEVTRLKLQEKGREEDTLRKVLELINGSDLAIDNFIHVASIWGHASKHSRLIDDFYFSSIYCEHKSTILHLLAENSDCEAIQGILTHIKEKHSDRFSCVLNAKNKYNITPLHSAVYGGNLNVIEYLVEKNADINAKDKEGLIPLHVAAEYENLEAVKYFIEKGIDVNVKDGCGSTPLHMAALYGNLEIVEYLVVRGADINAEAKGIFYSGTSLHMAAKGGNLEVVEYLVKRGAYLSAEDKDGMTLLHVAAENGNLDIVKYFVNKGADINARNSIGNTPLYMAAFCGKLEVVEYLADKGANANIKNKAGNTPLHLAAIREKVNIAKVLLEHNADINAENDEGATVLHYAIIGKNLEVVKYIIEKGANVNAKDKDGKTPLHHAVLMGKVDIAMVLLKHNANVNARNNWGMKVLGYAADDHQELVELLLAHGASYDY